MTTVADYIRYRSAHFEYIRIWGIICSYKGGRYIVAIIEGWAECPIFNWGIVMWGNTSLHWS